MKYRTPLEVIRYYEDVSPRVIWGILQTIEDAKAGRLANERNRGTIVLVKRIRELTGLPLYAAKDVVDIWARNGMNFLPNIWATRKWVDPNE